MRRSHLSERIFDIPEFREHVGVFDSRADAGQVLAGMLSSFCGTPATVLAIPAGGVPLGAIIARFLDYPLDVAIVSKITLPWNTEVGYGAAAFDGSVRLNEEMLPYLHLTPEELDEGTRLAVEKVRRRSRVLRSDMPMPDLSGQTAILVDDGLASGFTMQMAVEAVSRLGNPRIVLAVPTGHRRAIQHFVYAEERNPQRGHVDAIYCANIRGGLSFAVADAYREWHDVEDDEIVHILDRFRLATAGRQ